MEDRVTTAALSKTFKPDPSYRLYHVDKYELARRLIFRKKEEGSPANVPAGSAVPSAHQKPDAAGDMIKRVCVR